MEPELGGFLENEREEMREGEKKKKKEGRMRTYAALFCRNGVRVSARRTCATAEVGAQWQI